MSVMKSFLEQRVLNEALYIYCIYIALYCVLLYTKELYNHKEVSLQPPPVFVSPNVVELQKSSILT